MASSLRRAVHKNLECPVCLGFPKAAKMLTCSHTFCKGCLERLLECHQDKQNISCPVCRECTQISNGDMVKLPTCIALTSMIADAATQKKEHKNVKDGEMSDCDVTLKRSCKCEEHLNGDEECFCVNCGKYICYRCGVVEHVQEGHKVKEAERHKSAVKTSIEELISKAEAKKSDIDKHIACIAEQQEKCEMDEKQLHDNVNKAFENRVVELIERKEFLKSEGRQELKEIKTSLLGMDETSCQQKKRIDTLCELVKNGLRGPLQNVALKAHSTLCEELEHLLDRAELDQEGLRRMKEQREHIRFESNKGPTKNMLLGHVRTGEPKWTLVADIQLPTANSMNSLAASPNNTMSVGCYTGGIVTYSAHGKIDGTVLHNVVVRSFQYRSDCCYIVLNCKNKITVYTPKGKRLDLSFVTLSHVQSGAGSLTQDIEGYIFISYRKRKQIQVFNAKGGKSIREINCDGYEPWQIFVMPTSNRILVNDSNTVRVVDSLSGTTLRSITKDDVNAFPCLGKDDTVLIAWVNQKEGTVNISLYTSELKVTKAIVSHFKFPIPERHWYYLQTFKSGEIAFCTSDRLFIIRESSR
eukprot:XP_011667927.1 PREDICTED: uncharacterized protein LOC105440002 isoform X2 [Strongylocentrotus purpuratus]